MRKRGPFVGVILFFALSLPQVILAGDYIIGPEDRIELVVWREPDISRTVLVRPDGKISVPLVGDVQAAGLTPEALARKIERALAIYVKDPKVYVIVEEINSRRIYVLGRVSHPGMFPLHPDTTVLKAIAMAGGFAEWAKKRKVTILRRVGKEDRRIIVDLQGVMEGREGAVDIRLKPGDRVIVP